MSVTVHKDWKLSAVCPTVRGSWQLPYMPRATDQLQPSFSPAAAKQCPGAAWQPLGCRKLLPSCPADAEVALNGPQLEPSSRPAIAQPPPSYQ